MENMHIMADLVLEELADSIRDIYGSRSTDVEGDIRRFLEEKLDHLPRDEKVAQVERLAASFDENGNGMNTVGNEEVLTRICSLLLGRKVSQYDLSSSDLLERLAESLNTIFDTLNQLVHSIQTTLKGERPGDETIRQVIGVHLEGEDQRQSLESYLGQIKEAFWVTQQAFQQAAHTKVEELLAELEPGQIKDKQGKGFKFGPMRKAESFDMFEEKYKKIRNWFDRGRFEEDFLREFERKAHQMSS